MNIAGTLTELELPTEEYVVVGSGVLDALGLREVNDIDLVVSEALFEHLEALGDWQKDGGCLKHGLVEAYMSWDNADLAALKEDTKEIGGISYVSLKRLRAWKEQKGREKDQADIALIDGFLES